MAKKVTDYMTRKVISIRNLTRQSRVPMRIRIVQLERDFFQQRPLTINLYDPAAPRLRNHDPPIIQRLNRVYLHALTTVTILPQCVILPDHLLRGRINLDNTTKFLHRQNIPILQKMDIMNPTPLHLPRNLPRPVHLRQPPIPLQQHGMIREGNARKKKKRNGEAKDRFHNEKSRVKFAKNSV